eukprot:4482757-Prymnesium_polylepis.1
MWFGRAAVRMRCARCAKRSESWVSMALSAAGEHASRMTLFELPPSDSCGDAVARWRGGGGGAMVVVAVVARWRWWQWWRWWRGGGGGAVAVVARWRWWRGGALAAAS